jgi:hypothetical protein
LVSNHSTAEKNSAIGKFALYSNSTGLNNTGLGYFAGKSNIVGSNNTSIGAFAMENSTGDDNTAIGKNSLSTNVSGNKNTVIGSTADVASGALSNATAIGYGAIVSANNTIQLGANGTNGTTAISNVKTSGTITAGAVTYPKTDGTANQVLTTTGTGLLFWRNPGVPYTGATAAVNLGNYDLTVNGITVGRGAAGISTNTSIGASALSSNTTGSKNTAMGVNALQSNSSGIDNIAIGHNALVGNTTGNSNVGIGEVAGANNTTGEYNVSIGKQAMQQKVTGDFNVAVGAASIDHITAGQYNAVLGGLAGRYYDVGMGSNLTTAMNNSILIGYNSRPLINNSSNEIVIGASAIGNGANTTTIGGASTTDTYLKGNVHVSNALKISGGTPGLGKVLTSDANGLASWVTPAASGFTFEVSDELTATAGQVSFTLSNTPGANSKVRMYINGIRISKTAYSISGTTLTYDPTMNDAYTISVGDRIQFDFSY